MAFFLQLRLLLWKNFLIRRRNKVRLFLEIIWPLFLFLILMWVRTRGLKETRDECHYVEKAMPSAGQFAFFHSLICNAPNVCHLKNGSIATPSVASEPRPQTRFATERSGASRTRKIQKLTAKEMTISPRESTTCDANSMIILQNLDKTTYLLCVPLCSYVVLSKSWRILDSTLRPAAGTTPGTPRR